MGWFSKQKELDDQTKASTKKSRKQCWESRDRYFECLDRIDVVNPLDASKKDKIKKNCGKEDEMFNDNCATAWVKYFKEKRIVDVKKEMMLKKIQEEGGQLINLGYGGPSGSGSTTA